MICHILCALPSADCCTIVPPPCGAPQLRRPRPQGHPDSHIHTRSQPGCVHMSPGGGCHFPIAAVTNSHTLNGLKQPNVLFYASGGQNSSRSLTGRNPGLGRAAPSGGSRRRSFSCLFQCLRLPLPPIHGPCSISEASDGASLRTSSLVTAPSARPRPPDDPGPSRHLMVSRRATLETRTPVIPLCHVI